jgi:LPXTG-motif cell wall-anchored protein
MPPLDDLITDYGTWKSKSARKPIVIQGVYGSRFLGPMPRFGFYDTATLYTSIRFNNSDTTDIFGFDDFSVGSPEQVQPQPVPGPIAGAGLPALMALGGFVWARRRKAATVA